jgi:hypothetical protein
MNAEASKIAAQAERERIKAAMEALKLKQKEGTATEDVVTKQKKLNEAQAQGARMILSSNGHLSITKRLLGEMGTAASMYFSIFTAQHLLESLIRIRGEFDMQYISLKAILQSGEQASKLFEQIKGLAVVSPFKFMDLTTYAKQLSAYQIPTNELFDTTKRLADLSSGLGVDMNRIILAYGQVRSAAFLRGQELRQFTEAGIPMVDELANKFTKLTGKVTSAGDVFTKISDRQVPFQMVKEVIDDLTSEGGKFYNMQEKQAESLKGKVSNLADQYDIMMNRIGERNDGILKGGVDVISAIMQHSEKLLSIIIDLAKAYGVYKAYTMIQTAAMGKNISMMTAEEAKMRVKRANLLEEAQLYRKLSLEESKLVYYHGTLTNTQNRFGSGIFMGGQSRLNQYDYEELALSDRISKNEVLRLGYIGRISQATMVELAAKGKITQEEIKQVTLDREQVTQSKLVGVLSSLRVGKESATNAVIAARLALMRVGQGIMSAFSTIFNPTTLILGGATLLYSMYQDSQQQAQKIKDDAAKLSSDMKEEWNDIQKFISDHPIEIAIKGGQGAMMEYIKQYEDELRKILPEDLANSQIADLPFGANGKTRSMQEQLQAVKDLVQQAQQAKSIVEDNARALSDAADKQGGGFWSMSDGIIKNFNQFVDAFDAYKKEIAGVSREDISNALANPNDNLSAWMKAHMDDAIKLKNAVSNANVPMQNLIFMIKSMQGRSGFNIMDAFNIGNAANALNELTGPSGQLQTVMDQMGGMVEDFKNNLKDKNIDWASKQGHDVAETFKQKFLEQNNITDETQQTMFSFMFDEKMYGQTDAAFTLLVDRMKNSTDQKVREAASEFEQNGEWSEGFIKGLNKAKDDCINKFPMFKDELMKSWNVSKPVFEARITTTFNAQQLQGWQKELLRLTGGRYEIEIKTATNIDEALKSIQEGYKNAKQFIDSKKALMIRIGYQFGSGKPQPTGKKQFNVTNGKWEYVGGELDSAEQSEYIQKEIDKQVGDRLAKLGYLDGLGGSGSKTGKKGTSGGGTSRDVYTETLNRHYDEFKKAIQKYNDLLKSMGSDEAMNVIKKNFGFAISDRYLSSTGLINLANDYIKKNIKKTESAKSFGNTLKNDKLEAGVNYDKSIYDAQGKSILDSIQISKDQYKVYDSMFAKLGDARMAAMIAFGRDTKPYNTLVDMLKARFNEMAQRLKMNKGFSFEQMLGMSAEDRAKLPEDIQKLFKDAEDASTNNISQLREQFANALSNTDDNDIKLAINENLRKSILDGLGNLMKGANADDLKKATDAINGYYDKIAADIKFDEFKKNMSWDVVFSGIGDATQKTFETIRNNLKKYINSKEFGDLSANNKKTVMDKFKDLNEKIAVSDTTITSWGKLYEKWKAAREELEKAIAAQKKLNLDPNATEAQHKAANDRVTNAGHDYNSANSELDASTKKVTDLSSAIVSLGNSSNTSLTQVWSLAQALINAFSKGGNAISTKVGGIIGAILGILDSIGNQDIDKWAKNTANKVFTAFGGIFDSKYSLMSYAFGSRADNSFLNKTLKTAMLGPAGLLIKGNSIGASNKDYEDDMKDLSNSNKSLEKAIDRLAEKIKEAYTETMKSTYEKQLSDYKTEEANMRQQMQESGSNYSSGFLGLGGKHSSNSKVNNGMTVSDWERVSKASGVSVTNATEFWNLTSTQMANVFDNDLEMYLKIQDLANDGYSDAAQYMDDYIALSEKEKQLLDELKEKETSTTVSDITSGYATALDSMDDMTKTFSNNLTKTLRTAVINAFMQSKAMKSAIQGWYDKLAEYMSNGDTGENGSALSEGEISDLKERIKSINEMSKAEQQALKDLGLYADQSASSVSGGIKNITEETGDLLASYVNAIRADVSQQSVYNKLNNVAIMETRDVISETSTIIAQIKANTDDISRYTKNNSESVDRIENLLNSVTKVTSSGKTLRT